MKFISTRSRIAVSPSRALLDGIAGDGGLYTPSFFPDCSNRIDEFCGLNYRDLAYEILKLYFTDFSNDDLLNCVYSAYDDKFSSPAVAPLKKAGKCHFLELFHGPTSAFKDLALSILPRLLAVASKNLGESSKILILAATSGDTGKAALEAFRDVSGTAIAVFYPSAGVSAVQKAQMVTQEGANVFVAGISGNFDMAQTGVKTMFLSPKVREEAGKAGFKLSSANSINIGRLLPQIVYYFYSYAQMVKEGDISIGEQISFAVPTGNFGDILAGYYAKKMGLPVERLICASNSNCVLADFFASGVYDLNRKFFVTISPSMDILISSNFERLLFDLSDEATVLECMESLKTNKKYMFNKPVPGFAAGWADEEKTLRAIRETAESGYFIDPHTAVALAVWRDLGEISNCVILATASPYKFAADVLRAGGHKADSAFAALEKLSEVSGTAIPEKLRRLDKKPVRHNTLCDASEIEDVLFKFIGDLDE
ncbi:MAG: threonine synthase [Clostridiales bacterium]|jgi:threonine synthase|nr:threonine synthase [Clostridiales bacterium]